jgi:hypothetical protein
MKTLVARISFVLMVFILISQFGYSQQNREGVVNIYADERIDSLLLLHLAYNEAFPVMDGYRIHIFMGSGNEALDEAEEKQMEFEEDYEEVPAYITFAEPYYRVRVGDFRTRLEAEQFLQRIDRKYPNAWVIKEKINLPVLPKYQKSNTNE